jgi:hypothetical protein
MYQGLIFALAALPMTVVYPQSKLTDVEIVGRVYEPTRLSPTDANAQ